MKFSYFLIGFMILLAIPAYAKVTEISTTCDMFYCESYYNIDRDLSVYVGIKNIAEREGSYAYGEIVKHIGSINDVTVEITNKNIIKVSGYIEGGTDNLWGFSLLGDTSHLNSTWWNSSFYYRRNFIINGSYVKGNFTNFPLLINITDNNISYFANGSKNIAFANDSDVKLIREIVFFNQSSGKLIAWVKIPFMYYNTDYKLAMYYGGSGIDNNNASTWNGSYKLVQHLNGTYYGNLLDSTNNSNNAIAETGNVSYNNTGKIWKAIYCDGNDLINFGSSITLNTSNKFTLSFWVYKNPFTGTNRQIVAKLYSWTSGWFLKNNNASNIFNHGMGIADSGFDTVANLSLNVWHFITVTYDGSNGLFYYDGLLEGNYSLVRNSDSSGNFSVCSVGFETSSGYTGLIEEVRFENIIRDFNWINSTYISQNNPYAFLSMGAYEGIGVTIGTPIYNATTTERKLERYYINILTSTNITNATAYLTRNGTIYQSEVIATYNFSYGYTYINMYEFNNTFFTPYLSNSSLLNETVILNWTFFITYANGTQANFSSNNYNQLVETFFLSTCTSGYPIALNFTIFNEESMPSLINSSFNIYGTLAKGYEISKNFSFSFSGYSNYSICIYPNDTISVNATIEYYSNTDYPLRNYYLFNSPVSNATQSYNLYLLNATQARKVKISVIDSSSLAVKQAIISIQRYDYTTSAYITMTMAKTDDQGTAITYLRGNDMFYKFMITKNGVLLADLAPLKIDISAITNEGTLTLVADPTVLGEYYTFISSVAYGCTLNRTTDILRCSFADATGDTQTLTLQVDKITPLRKTSICDTIASSSSATLTCTIAGANGTYAYRFYAMRSGIPFMLETGSFAFTSAIEWGVTGLFLTLVLFLTLSGVGIYKPEMALVMGGGALIVASVLNLMAIEILSGSIGGMIVVIAILIYRMRGRD